MPPEPPEDLLRRLVPQVIGVLVRRGVDFATAEDAVQEALLEALQHWPRRMPDQPRAWLVTVAGRKVVDVRRSEASRRSREERVHAEPEPGPAGGSDDTLLLLFLCCHPALTPASAVALTLRAVGGLTTRQIAEAYLVPEATMAQRISRAKRTLAGVLDDGGRLAEPGDVRTVLRVLYLVFNEGYGGDVDLAAEAIRLTRGLAAAVDRAAPVGQEATADHPEALGLLALMLLHHARRGARRADDGSPVLLEDQDRSRWDTGMIAEGVALLQRALAADRLGEFQAQAAIAALHADAQRFDETDWPQIVEWYDELLGLTGSPVVALNRAIAVGEADGGLAGLRVLAEVDLSVPRRTAARAHLLERAGQTEEAAEAFAVAAREATSTAERDVLTRRAARLREAARG